MYILHISYIYISISWISDHGMQSHWPSVDLPLSKPRAGYVLNDKHPKTIRVACDRHLGRAATFGHLQYPMEFVAGNESIFWLSYISLKIRYIHICSFTISHDIHNFTPFSQSQLPWSWRCDACAPHLREVHVGHALQKGLSLHQEGPFPQRQNGSGSGVLTVFQNSVWNLVTPT